MRRRRITLWASIDQLLDIIEDRHRCNRLFHDEWGLHSLDGQLLISATARAEPEYAERLANMLLWDEICLNPNIRYVRACILEALAKIGTPDLIPFLEEYREKVKRVAYADTVKYGKWGDDTIISAAQFQAWDGEEIASTIAAILGRST